MESVSLIAEGFFFYFMEKNSMHHSSRLIDSNYRTLIPLENSLKILFGGLFNYGRAIYVFGGKWWKFPDWNKKLSFGTREKI